MPDGSQWTLFEINPLPSGPNRWDSAGQHAADSCSALLGSCGQKEKKIHHSLFQQAQG